MIVRSNGTRLLITQPDHAALAARIMAAWRAGGLTDSARRDAILLAVREHDNGWRELDASPILAPDGSVVDFMTAPDEMKQGVWPRAVQRLSAEPWTAALVAQHAIHVYRRYRASAAWTDFFARMESLRDEHVAASGESLETLLADYPFLRIGDLLSLTFCCGWTDEQKDDTGSPVSIRLRCERLVITPDPFEGADVPFEIGAREIGGAGVVLRGTASGRE